MSSILMHLLVLAIFSAISSAEVKRPTECDMWHEASTSTMKQEFLNVTCEANSFCTGFHCSGLFLFQSHVYMGSEPLGFTVEFIPCSYPLVMRIRVNSTDLHFSKMVGVHGRNEDAILLVLPGPSGNEEPFGRINMAWDAILKPVKYFVSLQINFTRIYIAGEFLPITIVPLQSYPIPNCQFDPKKDSSVTYRPQEKECVGMECEDDRLNHPLATLDSDFVTKMSVGVGVFLVALCMLLACAFVRRHRGSKRAQKVEVEEEDSSSDDEASASSSQASFDDKKNLLRV